MKEFYQHEDKEFHYEVCPLCKGHRMISWILSKEPVNVGCEPCPKCEESGLIEVWHERRS